MVQRKNTSNNLNLFNQNKFPLFTFFLIFIICLILMGFDYRYQISKKIKSELSIVISSTNYLINAPIKVLNEIKTNFKEINYLVKENETLKEKIYNLSIKIQENKLLNSENKQLRKTLKIQKDYEIIGENAEIVLPNVRNGYSLITINKGIKNNIKNGAPVINNKGLIGQIINTYTNYSEVRPITSKTFAVPAILNNGKENVILYGNGNGELEIPLFPASSPVNIDDIFVTSGIDDTYPKGINIGKVTEIKITKSPKFNYILIKPFFQPTTFSQITVLTINKNE